MGEALRGAAADRGGGRGAAARRLIARAARRAPALLLALALLALALLAATPRAVRPQEPGAIPATDVAAAVRLDAGRFTFLAYPPDVRLARSLLRGALARDTFPGLPRPADRAVVAIAPDAATFRAWTGQGAPEWGAAVAIPSLRRVVLRGGSEAASAGDPHVILRHELAHLALSEHLGSLPPRWFDEGYASYAAGEWGREQVLVANVALLYRRMPGLDSLDRSFRRGAREAEGAYALAHRAVAELAAMDPERGLTLFFRYWAEGGRLDPAVRAAYGITLDGFEERWRARTRRRYGVLALLGELSVGAGFALLVVLPVYLLRRQRDRQRWADLRRRDAIALATTGVRPEGWEAPAPEWDGELAAPATLETSEAPAAGPGGGGPAVLAHDPERRPEADRTAAPEPAGGAGAGRANGRNPSLDTDFGQA
jgi:hypothetical protein